MLVESVGSKAGGVTGGVAVGVDVVVVVVDVDVVDRLVGGVLVLDGVDGLVDVEVLVDVPDGDDVGVGVGGGVIAAVAVSVLVTVGLTELADVALGGASDDDEQPAVRTSADMAMNPAAADQVRERIAVIEGCQPSS